MWIKLYGVSDDFANPGSWNFDRILNYQPRDDSAGNFTIIIVWTPGMAGNRSVLKYDTKKERDTVIEYLDLVLQVEPSGL